MLKGIDPLLSPDLLKVLGCMGHGDEIAIVDANYPADAMGLPVVRLAGISAPAAVEAILSVFPLDTFVPESAWRMEIVDDPDADQPVFAEFRDAIRRQEGDRFRLGSIERHAFYQRARRCFAIVATGERRLYGDIILKKGVVRPSE